MHHQGHAKGLVRVSGIAGYVHCLRQRTAAHRIRHG
jgi:hypothetical protein